MSFRKHMVVWWWMAMKCEGTFLHWEYQREFTQEVGQIEYYYCIISVFSDFNRIAYQVRADKSKNHVDFPENCSTNWGEMLKTVAKKASYLIRSFSHLFCTAENSCGPGSWIPMSGWGAWHYLLDFNWQLLLLCNPYGVSLVWPPLRLGCISANTHHP